MVYDGKLARVGMPVRIGRRRHVKFFPTSALAGRGRGTARLDQIVNAYARARRAIKRAPGVWSSMRARRETRRQRRRRNANQHLAPADPARLYGQAARTGDALGM